MKLLIVLMFFFGILLIIHGIYEDKFKKLKKNVKTQYRFVPRSYYDEQIFSNQFSSKLSNIFDEDQDEWSANQRAFTPYKSKKPRKPKIPEIDEETDEETDEDTNEETENETENETDIKIVKKKFKKI